MDDFSKKIISRLLPICASFNKTNDDKGYWNLLEIYFDFNFFNRLLKACWEIPRITAAAD